MNAMVHTYKLYSPVIPKKAIGAEGMIYMDPIYIATQVETKVKKVTRKKGGGGGFFKSINTFVHLLTFSRATGSVYFLFLFLLAT